jgi:hypothetical protein
MSFGHYIFRIYMYSFLNRDKTNIDVSKAQIVSLAFPTPEDLPSSSFGYHTNNVYQGFPPLMADARSVVASWQPESYTNDRMIRENGIQSNWQYRQYLTQNATAIMKQNFSESANDIGYYDINASSIASRPITASSDLKELYMSREDLQSRRIAPVLTQEQMMQMLSKK